MPEYRRCDLGSGGPGASGPSRGSGTVRAIDARPIPSDPRRDRRVRREVAAFAELFALSGLAIAQPVFDLLGRNPELFILWRTTRLQLLALTAIVLLVVPLAALAAEWVVGLIAPRARPWVHAGLLG